MAKRSGSDEGNVGTKRPKQGLLFYEETSSEESSVDDIEWEDVPLYEESEVINVEIQKKEVPSKKKRGKPIQYQKLKFGMHIILMPFLLATLRRRMVWARDERLNRRLKRSVPKVISKKFDRLLRAPFSDQDKKLKTLLLGLVFWFRSHYKINSNGFRQNFNRLSYLIKFSGSNSEMYREVLNNPQNFYGSCPKIQSLEDVRSLAKNRMANRDYLVLFFFIILKNLLGDERDLRLCFALPLPEFQIMPAKVASQIKTGVGRVPNRYDTDLLSPYFWIECKVRDDLYIIDPIVNVDQKRIVMKARADEYVPHIKPLDDLKINYTQRFHYIVSIANDMHMMDVSPRYLDNICYRYFNTPSTVFSSSKPLKSSILFRKFLRKYGTIEKSKEYNSLVDLALQNYKIPKTLIGMKRSDNFTMPSLLKANEVISASTRPVGTFCRGQQTEEYVYWKKDILRLKSRQHWALLGRTVKMDAVPMKSKKVHTMKMRREKRLYMYEIRELYTFEQTIATPKMNNTYLTSVGGRGLITDVYHFKNAHGHVEIYNANLKPDGFEMFAATKETKLLIRQYNRDIRKGIGFLKDKYVVPKLQCLEPLKFLDVVSGFDFKQTPGYAVPVLNQILVNHNDFCRLELLIGQNRELQNLDYWQNLLQALQVKRRIDKQYGNKD